MVESMTHGLFYIVLWLTNPVCKGECAGGFFWP